MVKFETLDKYRKMRLWINEIPENNNIIVYDKVLKYNANNNIHWFNGILCLELRIAPRVASNYAMLSLRFTQNQDSRFLVKYSLASSDEVVESDIAMENDVVRTGIVKEYQSALIQIFNELESKKIFPSGTLEI